jgi:hypothetical protein
MEGGLAIEWKWGYHSITPYAKGRPGDEMETTKTAAPAVEFQKFYVTNGTTKARVHYHLDNRADGQQCVTLYARDYDRALGKIIADQYVNETDTQTDYFDKGRVVLFPSNPLYAAARARAEQNDAERAAKYARQA